MSLATMLAGVLAAIVVLASLRLWLRQRRARQSGWRFAALLAGQPLLAVLLYFALLPPPAPGRAGALIVLSAGVGKMPARGAGDIVVALPEATPIAGVERVPDLGTALRRYPAAGPLRVSGAGLVARDRDAAKGEALQFTPADLPTGLVALEAPTQASSGRRFTVSGRIEGQAPGVIDLLDPAGRRIDRAQPGKTGRFRLSGVAGPAGRVEYRLQRRDAAGAIVEDLALPMQVDAGAPLRVLMLAGGASPELKYLRRWAVDSGLALRTQISLGGGVELGDPPLPVNAATLGELDLVVLDERAWRALGDGGRAALRDAAQGGLGVLLRITGDLSERDRAALRAWGFDARAADVARSLRLPGTGSADLPGTRDSAETRATDTAPLLSRRALALSADDGAPLLRDAAGATLALWRPEGRGRLAVWTLSDSFRLALAGRATAYGSLWAESFATLARPRASTGPALPSGAREGLRSQVCGLAPGLTLHGPDGDEIPLPIDPALGTRRCAAFWPAEPGWHELRSDDQRWAFPVRGRDEAPGLLAAERREATLALVNTGGPGVVRPVPVAGARWPWMLAWLCVTALLWLLERSRPGRRRESAGSREGGN